MNQPQRQQLAPAAGNINNNNAAAAGKGNNGWFQGAPATKILLACNVLLHVVLYNNAGPSEAAALQLDSYAMTPRHGGGTIILHKDLYRYVTSKLTFGTTGELIVGTGLCAFLLRKYERELGSRRLVAYAAFAVTAGVAQEVALVQLLQYANRVLDLPQMWRWRYAGPYAVAGALFALFHWTAPRLHPRFVSVLGFQFSEKSFYYLWFLHLISSGGWNTVVPTLTGCASALLYLHTPWLKEQLQVPAAVVRTVQPALDRLGLSDAPAAGAGAARGGGAAAAAPAARQQQQQPRRPQPQQQPMQQQQQQPHMIPTPEPDPAAIEQLTSMGFPRQRVQEALRQSHNNVEHAANRLLTDTTST